MGPHFCFCLKTAVKFCGKYGHFPGFFPAAAVNARSARGPIESTIPHLSEIEKIFFSLLSFFRAAQAFSFFIQPQPGSGNFLSAKFQNNFLCLCLLNLRIIW